MYSLTISEKQLSILKEVLKHYVNTMDITEGLSYPNPEGSFAIARDMLTDIEVQTDSCFFATIRYSNEPVLAANIITDSSDDLL